MGGRMLKEPGDESGFTYCHERKDAERSGESIDATRTMILAIQG